MFGVGVKLSLLIAQLHFFFKSGSFEKLKTWTKGQAPVFPSNHATTHVKGILTKIAHKQVSEAQRMKLKNKGNFTIHRNSNVHQFNHKNPWNVVRRNVDNVIYPTAAGRHTAAVTCDPSAGLLSRWLWDHPRKKIVPHRIRIIYDGYIRIQIRTGYYCFIW